MKLRPPARLLLRRYVTVLRHPVARALSHYRMGVAPVSMPSIGWEGSPFGPKREVGLRLFAQGPLRQCAICAARGKIAGPQTDPKQMASGGDHRHCCRRQWKYAADNYFIRELTG